MKRRALMLCFVAWSCADQAEVSVGEAAATSDALFEAWDDWSEAPSRMIAPAETRLAVLPSKGEVARTPWPGNHWAVHLDAINYRWDGPDSRSASEKFAAAFGVPDFEARISRNFGVEAYEGTPCQFDGDCDKDTICGKRRDAKDGRCVGAWWGICDGWSAAAIAAPEPQVPVVRNGVTFKVNDIKALLSVAYQGYTNNMVGARCNHRAPAVCDPVGRPYSVVDRSTNPGSFHIILSNFVGLQQRSFVIDRDPSHRVFNQPVSRYEVTEFVPLTQKRATRHLGGQGKHYFFNDQARAWYRVKTTLYYMMDPEHFADGPLLPYLAQYETPLTLEYILELDADGNIIGGEWLGASKLLHPDFAWTFDLEQTPTRLADFLRPNERRAIFELSTAASPSDRP